MSHLNSLDIPTWESTKHCMPQKQPPMWKNYSANPSFSRSFSSKVNRFFQLSIANPTLFCFSPKIFWLFIDFSPSLDEELFSRFLPLFNLERCFFLRTEFIQFYLAINFSLSYVFLPVEDSHRTLLVKLSQFYLHQFMLV